MHGEIPSNLAFDDAPLDEPLAGTGEGEPSPADALAAWQRRDDLADEWRRAAVAILARDPGEAQSLTAAAADAILEPELRALGDRTDLSARERLRLARLCLAARRLDEAEAVYRQALAMTSGPPGLTEDESRAARRELARLLEAAGKSGAAEVVWAEIETDELFDGLGLYELADAREVALGHFREGRYRMAECIYRRLLEVPFQGAGTGVHLTRVLLMQDRLGEARQALAAACRAARRPWFWEEVPVYVWPRVLFLRLAMAMLGQRPMGLRVRLAVTLRCALRASPEQEPWTIGPVVEHLRPALSPADGDLLSAFAEAINDPDMLDALDAAMRAAGVPVDPADASCGGI